MFEFGNVFRISVGALFILVGMAASGHPLSVSYSHFVAGPKTVEAVYRLPMDDMDLIFNLDTNLDGSISEVELSAAHDEIKNYLGERVDISNDGLPLAPVLVDITVWRDSDNAPYLEAGAVYRSPRAIGDLRIGVQFLTDLYPDHQNLGRIVFGDKTREFVFQHGNHWSAESGMAETGTTFATFSLLGIEHIAGGFDHLLFLLGLLLVGHSIRNMVAIVSSFTVAHSLTLALAVSGILTLPGRFVEVAIALSIVYVGVENIRLRQARNRWITAFLFGLVHGFGFASVLKGMELATSGFLLSLLSFNLGVEAGQIVIVACCWPVLRVLQRNRNERVIVRIVSAGIVIAGLYWLTERIT